MPHSAGDRGGPIGDPCACLKPRPATLKCCIARACSIMVGTSSVQMRTCRVALPLRLPRKMRSCCALSFKSIIKIVSRLDAMPLACRIPRLCAMPARTVAWQWSGKNPANSWLRHRNGSAAPARRSHVPDLEPRFIAKGAVQHCCGTAMGSHTRCSRLSVCAMPNGACGFALHTVHNPIVIP